METLWEREKLLVTSYFSFSHDVRHPFGELPAILVKSKIVVCKLFQFGKCLNLPFWKGLKASDGASLTEIDDTVPGSTEQDQTACKCRLILFYTLRKINLWSSRTG